MLTKEEKFTSLIEGHKSILYKVANSYCRNPDDRPDLIQEILIQLWRSFERFDGRGKFSTWMYQISLNVAFSFYRSGRRHNQGSISIDNLGLDLAATDHLVSTMSDEIHLLHQAIGRLDEMNRALILLYLDGYKHSEISEMTGISATNVATRLNRVKQRLQDELDGMEKTGKGN